MFEKESIKKYKVNVECEGFQDKDTVLYSTIKFWFLLKFVIIKTTTVGCLS